MKFKNEQVRFAFHALPTARQVEYVEWEEELARSGNHLIVDEVECNGKHLEVSIRISPNFEISPVTGDDVT